MPENSIIATVFSACFPSSTHMPSRERFSCRLLNGSKMVLVDRFQPLKVMKLIEDHAISVFLAIPSMYRVLAHTEGDFNLKSVRFPISGGEPLPIAVAEAFEKRFGVPIFEGYGQTEASPVISLNVADEDESWERWARPCPEWKSLSGMIRRIPSTPT